VALQLVASRVVLSSLELVRCHETKDKLQNIQQLRMRKLAFIVYINSAAVFA
jgi:hypothetical protein